MPEQLDEEATRTVRRLLYENWVPDNAGSFDPVLDPVDDPSALPITFGSYNASLADPQISISQPQGEFNATGGRWSGKNMTTGEMNEIRRGLVFVQCWAESGEDYNGESAQNMVRLLRVEVERIVNEFTFGPEEGPNDFIWSFSSEWNGRFPDPQDDPGTPTWQSQVTVTYDWERSQ